ncbi:RBPJ-interacting and tubulin-associated protein 1-like [Saccostrea echinata]|uniref:RBPJ-interacting and tubulin-associated protein 1-like n=1 Tax=Saccostrea echinata TaxID=191078 RepID=UPI002A821ED1|nr:RBPJ-interacting and tubulin-associated protein 1-like [Saccostrea echinata]
MAGRSSERLSWLTSDKDNDKAPVGNVRASIYEKFKLWGLLSETEAEKAERYYTRKMADTFVITGTRPPSSSGSRPRSGYRKVSNTAEVDETLFRSHNFTQVHDSQSSKFPFQTKTPKEKKRGPPLLWAPSPTEQKPSNYHNFKPRVNHSSESQRYRFHNHKPTFVDETLFGHKLEEPSFEAPWAEKKKKPPVLNWAPQDFSSSRQMTQANANSVNEPFSLDGRPPSRQGRRPASTRNRPCTVESVASSRSYWKP